MATGEPIRAFQKGKAMNDEARGFRVSYRILDLPREELYDRINSRVDQMVLTELCVNTPDSPLSALVLISHTSSL